MNTAIEFNNISKQYRLGLVSTRTLSHDLNRWWTVNIRRKEDPYLKIGDTNDRSSKGDSEYVWALKDVNFKVEQGDVVGIIGKNGAGKSTLLKLLSKVTAPTTGTIRAKGRIGSLLEVGTGFHSEMTGRENIYMNGAILGMTKQEITRKLDEIIDFSGCERYIDTPVKRYSSGMMVRLGFAVAAHLDPEILVVDEVLAVGDAEFQKKAIGKMQDVSQGEGRTVLFVSHNMAAIADLCKSCVLLSNGMVKASGDVQEIVNLYLAENFKTSSQMIQNISINDWCFVRNFMMMQDDSQTSQIYQGQPYKVVFDVDNTQDSSLSFIVNLEVKTESGISVTCFGNEFQYNNIVVEPHSVSRVEIEVEELLLRVGNYFMTAYFDCIYPLEEIDKYVEYGVKFSVNSLSQRYLANTDREWKAFPTEQQNGYVATKVKAIHCERLK